MTIDRPVLLSYRTLGLGDLLTAVPALRALRRAFPAHRHVLATPRWLGPVVAMVPGVDEHLPLPELAPVPTTRLPVDVAVNLHGRGPQSHHILRACRPRRLVAFARPQSDAPGPAWRDDEHEVRRWCRLLAAHGIPSDPTRLDLAPPPATVPAPDTTVVHPGAKAGARRWPVERFAAVARHEAAAGRRVVVTGSPDEVSLARRLADLAALPADAVLAGTTDLAGLARRIAAAGRVVAGDTGVAHLATAFGTPSVILFGPTPPATWGPPEARRDRHRVLWAGHTGDPLGDTPDPGLLRITVRDVLRELTTLPTPAAA